MSHGIATGDLDNDVTWIWSSTASINRPLFIETRVAPRLAVRLRGLAPNTRIGARVTVAVGNLRQTQEMIAEGAIFPAINQCGCLRSVQMR